MYSQLYNEMLKDVKVKVTTLFKDGSTSSHTLVFGCNYTEALDGGQSEFILTAKVEN